MRQGSFSNADTGPQDYDEYEDSEVIDLHKACRLGDITAIKQAFRAQPDKLNEKDASVPFTQLGWAPLYRTVICGHLQAVEFLLKQGANPNVVNNVRPKQLGETPLHQAADNSQLAVAELLLQYSADPNAQQNDGDTPLHLAAFKGDLQMVDLLLRFKANPNVQNYMLGKTPFHYAVSGGHVECIQSLFLSGADLEICDKQMKSVYNLSSSSQVHDMLLSFKSSPRLPDFDEEFSHEVGRIHNHMLSPISEVISFNQSDMDDDPEVNLHLGSPIAPDKLDTIHETPRKTAPVVVDVERSAKKKFVPVLKPLYEWLEKDNLQDLYEVLVEAGYDDVEEMVEQMRSPLPISEESLRNIGVSKPGHCVRLLMRLEEESGLKAKFTRLKSPHSHKNFLQCCTAPNNTTFGLVNSPSLQEWLRQLKLEHLYDNFKSSGYDDYESLLNQMMWRKPLSEEVLEREVKVMKPGHRSRILSKLQEDVMGRDRSEGGLVVESGGKLVACEMCAVI